MQFDKLDKIGIEKVKEELKAKNLSAQQIEIVENYLSIDGSNLEKLSKVKSLFGEIEKAKKGIEEIEYILNFRNKSEIENPKSKIEIDFTLARGLNYYTGIIYEVKAKDVAMGSIGGGGRYDDLTGTFGVPNIPGVGISFGVDRIYDVMEELKLFPEIFMQGQRLYFLIWEKEKANLLLNKCSN